MRSTLIITLALCSSEVSEGKPIKVSAPQAAPILTILEAVQDSDLDLFKSAYTIKMRMRIKEKDWPVGMKVYRNKLLDKLGKYQKKDLEFNFEGEGDKGRILLSHKGRPIIGKRGIRIAKENGVWKLAER